MSEQKYTVIINLVKKRSVEELTERIRRGRVISKQTVINDSAYMNEHSPGWK